jgi:predicted phage terminase large subunit-like protein
MLKAAVINLAQKFRPGRILIEDTGSGTALCQELRSTIPVVPIKPDRDKETRMSVVSAKFETGQVHFPTNAPWMHGLETELFSFPGSKHDDQCDSISQALDEKNHSFGMLVSTQDLLDAAAKARLPVRSPFNFRRY